LLTDTAKRDRLANCGYQFVQQFDWETIAREHLKIYTEVMDERVAQRLLHFQTETGQRRLSVTAPSFKVEFQNKNCS